MHNVENLDTIYTKIVWTSCGVTYSRWKRIGTEKDLIQYLAGGIKDELNRGHYAIIPLNWDLDDIATWYFPYWWNCRVFRQEYQDGYGRIIIPKIYKHDAWQFYYNVLKNRKDENSYSYKRKNKIYIGSFRRTPVVGIHKLRGGPHIRPRKIKQIKTMYANPEYKEFNRGSKKEYPLGWWDDWYRCTEKNWKSQGKYRHQWEKHAQKSYKSS